MIEFEQYSVMTGGWMWHSAESAVAPQTLSQWHDTAAHSWDQGDGNDIAPQIRRNTDIAQTIQASGEQM